MPTAYCLMTNHYHLLVETPDDNLSKGMGHLNGVYTQHVNVARAASVTSSRGASKAFSSSGTAICWSWPATWC